MDGRRACLERGLHQETTAAAAAPLGKDPHPEREHALGLGRLHAEAADRLAVVLEHEEEVAVPFDGGAEALLEFVGRRLLGGQPAAFGDDGAHPARQRPAVLDPGRPVSIARAYGRS